MRYGIASLLALLFPLLMASCALHFPKQKVERQRVEVAARSPELEAAAATIPILLFSDKLHTGLILELAWLERNGYVKPEGIGERKYVAFSWGDETAYVQQRWLSPAQVIHALFLPSGAVMEIIPFDWNVPEVCHHQRLYQGFVPESAGKSLAGFLNHCTVTAEDGRPETIAPSSWGEGLLIRSPHAYYFPRICNIWTVDALRAAGFEISGLSGMSASGVIRQATKPENGFQKIWDPAWQMGDEDEEGG